MKLDFVTRTAPNGRAARALALAGVAALALSGARYYNSSQTLQLAQAQSRAAAHGAPRKSLTRVSATDAAAIGERVGALNGHIRALNFPWGSVLKSLQPPAALGVSVLRVELDAGQSNLLHVAAQAEQSAGMAEYVVYLGDGRGFSSAFLRTHERLKDDPAHPYRFEIEATWTGAR
jgi:hypothetical protein